MEKKLKSEEGGYNYFENLPDKLVISIFAKLSSSEGCKTLDDIKSLGRCSQVSKRFNALTCLVPTLTISIPTLYDYCPKILNKFKHIRSLRVAHIFSRTHLLDLPEEKYPLVYRKITVDGPHKYYVEVVSCTHAATYKEPHRRQSLMLDSDSVNKDLMDLTRLHCTDLFNLYHMLIHSIKDHKFLQSVVIADLDHTLTLDEDILVKLRNCGITDLEQVEVRMWTGSAVNMDIPLKEDGSTGIMMNNTCFSIIKAWEKSSSLDDDDDDDFDFDVKDYNPLNMVLYKMLKNPEADD